MGGNGNIGYNGDVGASPGRPRFRFGVVSVSLPSGASDDEVAWSVGGGRNGAKNGSIGGITIVIGTVLSGEPLDSISSCFLDAFEGLPRFFLLEGFPVIIFFFLRLASGRLAPIRVFARQI